MDLKVALRIMNEEGPRIWQYKQLFRKVVMEVLPLNDLYKKLVLLSAEENIPDDIMRIKIMSQTTIESLCLRMTNACGCSHDLAEEIVKAWIYALGAQHYYLEESQKSTALFKVDRSTLIKYMETEIGITVYVPDGISKIAEDAFSGSSVKEVILPDSVTEIGDRAFKECRMLQRIRLPRGLRELGNELFWFCSSLSSIEIPEGVEKISPFSTPFAGCESLKEVSMSTQLMTESNGLGLPSPCRVKGYGGYEGDFIIEGKTLIRYIGNGKDAQIRVPKGIKNIADNAFALSSLEEVILPTGLERIGSYAFDQCNNLKKVSLPKSLQIIGRSAFNFCRKLSSINIPDRVTCIGERALQFSSSLKEITLTPNLIREYHKYGLPSECNVKCSVPCENGFYIHGDSLIRYFGKKTDLTVRVPEGVKKISKQAFYRSDVLVVIIPDGVTVIDDEAFFECDSLEKVVLPNSLKRIGSCAFQFCESLTEIDIPEHVTVIEDYAFANCSSLTRISVKEKLRVKLVENNWEPSTVRDILKTKE